MIISFGKYKGMDISDVPFEYLEWGIENLTNSYSVSAFKEELEKRKSGNSFPDEINMDDVIFGKDKTEKVVNVTLENDKVYLYKAGSEVEIYDYYPWVLSNQPSPNRPAEKLKGSQYYRYLTEVTCEDYKKITEMRPRGVWYPRNMVETFLLKEGVTYFKGMNPKDLTITSFDIETTGVDPRDKSAEVILISVTTRYPNGNTETKMWDITQFKSDTEMISDWCHYVKKADPDVILGHNIFGFDLEYLNVRSKNGLPIGRDGSLLRFDERVSKFRKDGSQQYDYLNARCHGRELICTMFLSIKYDIGREFPSYGLKQLEKHLGLVDDSRTFWDFEKNKPSSYKSWSKELWTQFREYCKDDTKSPIKIFDLMIPTFFYLNQTVPKTFQQVINEATGSQIDSVMIRAYLQDGYSQPMSSQKSEYQGAISFGIPGYYENVFSVDFHALYPSIIKQYKLFDAKKDPKGYLFKLTEYFTKVRVEYKKKFKETGNSMYDGMQLAAKVFANSLYGFCGANYLLYNAPDIAAKITEYGRKLLNDICLVATGYDTDYWKPVKQDEEEEENEV